MNEFYTYAYLREDGTPYYIGKGYGYRIYHNRRKIKPPKDKSRIVFLKKNLTEEEAFKHEKYMIAIFGRKDNGTGILRNLTDGGEGCSGILVSEETRKKMSKAKIGNRNGMFRHNQYMMSKDNIKKLKERMSGSKNYFAKTILIVNINGENYIVRGEFIQFCKNKNIPYMGLMKRKQRGSKTPTKCGWSYFDITNKSESEVDELKSKFILKHKNRFNLDLIDIKIPSDSQVTKQSVNLVFNFIKEKIKNEYDIKYHNSKKYTKITEEEFKELGVSSKTAYRAVKVLKINDIVKVEKLNKSNFNHNNYYAICDLKYLQKHQ